VNSAILLHKKFSKPNNNDTEGDDLELAGLNFAFMEKDRKLEVLNPCVN